MKVVGVVATQRRPEELGRLIQSLESSTLPLLGIVVVDNGNQESTRAKVTGAGMPAEYLAPDRNLGCGGGLALAEQQALQQFSDLTHVWILDDDAVVMPDTLKCLLDAMDSEKADAAHPLVTAPDGSLGWYPGLTDARKFAVIKRRQTPEEFIAACGDQPILFSWCQGIALLVTRRVFEQLGFHRTDYWVRGEDLEFTLRITARFRGIYVPGCRVQHLPPATAPDARAMEYRRHTAMLQNIAYTALRLPHGRRIAKTIPGNLLRFFRCWGWSRKALQDVVRALIDGWIRGRPAGFGTSTPQSS